VEDVKQKYTNENELLKSSLTLLTNKQNILFTEGKDAIIDFYSNFNKWLWHSLYFSAHEYNLTNFTELPNRLLTMADYYNDSNISFGKIQLIISDDKLILAAHETIMETLKLHQFMETTIRDLNRILTSEKTLFDTLFSKEYKFDNLSREMKDFYQDQAMTNSSEKKVILDGFHDKRTPLFSNAIAKRNIFRDLAREYLSK